MCYRCIYARGGSGTLAGYGWLPVYFYLVVLVGRRDGGVVEPSKPDPGNGIDVSADAAEHGGFEVSPEGGNRWYRSLVENSSEVVSIVDPEGPLRYASPAWRRVLGYDPEEVVGTNILDQVHPDDLPRVLEATEE